MERRWGGSGGGRGKGETGRKDNGDFLHGSNNVTLILKIGIGGRGRNEEILKAQIISSQCL